jgi:hypothetical protein
LSGLAVAAEVAIERAIDQLLAVTEILLKRH